MTTTLFVSLTKHQAPNIHGHDCDCEGPACIVGPVVNLDALHRGRPLISGVIALTDDDELVASWDTWLARASSSDALLNRHAWLAMLRRTAEFPDDVNEILWCADCERPGHLDNGHTAEEQHVCGECIGNYTECTICDDYARDTWTTVNDNEICARCRDNYFNYCEDCEGYYRDGDAEYHTHGRDDCDCESPLLSFTVRNDGEPPLANDVRVAVSLPAGQISDEGIDEIGSTLRRLSLDLDHKERVDFRVLSMDSVLLDKIGNAWQTREGNFTKRLSRYAYKHHALKLSPELLSQIGNIARDHSTAVEFQIEVTRDLNLDPEDFCNEDSCWWGSCSESRCALKTNGGYALRTFAPSYGGRSYVTGRAWVLPLKLNGEPSLERPNLLPTFNTDSPAAFVVFNGYGHLGGYAPARIVAHMAGMTYRRVSFSCSPMYINSGGYLVAPEDIAHHFTDGSLYLEVEQHSNLYETERKELTNAA